MLNSLSRESLRILVVIASYGSQNDVYLHRVLAEYRSMPYQMRLVVVSNIQKDLGPDVEVRVGLPEKNPWSLPFAHKQIFADEIDRHDLFIYSEDDILLTAANISAFREQAAILPPHQIPGFLRIEEGPNGAIQYCDIHGSAYWDPQSLQSVGGRFFAHLSNEHAACYILTRDQLRIAIESENFLVTAHEGKYDMLCSAATDPFTRCGFRKMICISDIEKSSVRHLPNKYWNVFGLSQRDLSLQIDALLRIDNGSPSFAPLIQMEPRLRGGRCLRDHYGPARAEILSCIPDSVRSVLSFGCGETEVALAQQGIRVVAVPVDSVVSAAAATKGVELVAGDLDSVVTHLQGKAFDCLLLLDVLHLVKQPTEVIASLLQFLKKDGVVIALVPHLAGIRFLRGWLKWGEGRRSYRAAGINLTSPRVVRKWLESCGLVPEMLTFTLQHSSGGPEIPIRAIFNPILAKEFIVQAKLKGDSG